MTSSLRFPRNSTLWTVARIDSNGETIMAPVTFPTRSEARQLKSSYRGKGIKAWVVRYDPMVDFGS